jgi:hypothetical protein
MTRAFDVAGKHEIPGVKEVTCHDSCLAVDSTLLEGCRAVVGNAVSECKRFGWRFHRERVR